MDISCSYWLLYLLLLQPMVGAHTTYFRFTAHRGLEFFNTLVIQYKVLLLQYYSITVWSAAPQITLWGCPEPRFEPRTGDLEAETITTRPPHLLKLDHHTSLIDHRTSLRPPHLLKTHTTARGLTWMGWVAGIAGYYSVNEGVTMWYSKVRLASTIKICSFM